MTRHELTAAADDAAAGIRVIAGLSAIVPDYDVILCDIWGVLHDGATAHPQAWRALAAARDQGIAVVLMSNAPRPGAVVAEGLRRMGIPDRAFDGIVTSGDLTRDFLAGRPGTPVFHLGPSRDLVTFAGLDIELTGMDRAGLLVCTDLRDEYHETPEDYRDLLVRAVAMQLPLLCANPDITVERGDRQVHCAGAIARLYEEIGGATLYFGKPHLPIYQAALKLSSGISRAGAGRVLCIGDALHTDMDGAVGSGLDGLFIADGIHALDLEWGEDGQIDPPSLRRLFRGRTPPVAVLSRLEW